MREIQYTLQIYDQTKEIIKFRQNIMLQRVIIMQISAAQIKPNNIL